MTARLIRSYFRPNLGTKPHRFQPLRVTRLRIIESKSFKKRQLNHFVRQVTLPESGFGTLFFTTKVVESQNFSPHLNKFLLLVGGTAKTGRSAWSSFVVTKNRPEDHQ